jgi:HK97 family phage major capsid protein
VATYNSIISRADTQALVPEVVSNDILTTVVAESAALSLFRHVPMSTSQTRMPVLAALPIAYFVNGDTGLKQTTEVNWDNKYLNVEEIATIVPIPEAVLDDASFDIWGAIKPMLATALGRLLDDAIFFGVNKPASWPTDIVTAAVAAGNTVTHGTNSAALGGIVGDFSDLFTTVELDGFDVNGIIAHIAAKGWLRQARATTGESLQELAQQVTSGSAYGVDLTYPMRGLWPTGSGATQAIAGDYTNGIVGVRQDVTYKVLDQAVITGADGSIIYNLPQQDMVALRVVARYAWQVANTINFDQTVEANRYPFAVLKAA